MEYFYKLAGELNEKYLKEMNLSMKIKRARNEFLKERGLLNDGMEYYDFTLVPNLTWSQLRALNAPKDELKMDGTPRKNSATMKKFNKEYKEHLESKGISTNKNDDPENFLRWGFFDLMIDRPMRFSHSRFCANGTVYYKGNSKLKESDEIIKITGSEFYTAYENK